MAGSPLESQLSSVRRSEGEMRGWTEIWALPATLTASWGGCWLLPRPQHLTGWVGWLPLCPLTLHYTQSVSVYLVTTVRSFTGHQLTKYGLRYILIFHKPRAGSDIMLLFALIFVIQRGEEGWDIQCCRAGGDVSIHKANNRIFQILGLRSNYLISFRTQSITHIW